MTALYERPFVAQLENRLSGEKPLIQVLVGPRQVGKKLMKHGGSENTE